MVISSVGMMGYVQFAQTTHGIHYRLRARAFVIVDKATNVQVTYVNLDLCFATSAIKRVRLLSFLFVSSIFNSTCCSSGGARQPRTALPW